MNDTKEILEENAYLKSELDLWKNKYQSLFEQFKLSQQRQFAPKSEKNVHQSDLFDEAGTVLEEEQAEKTSNIEVPAHQRSKAKRKPLPKDLPREDIIHDIPENKKICSCGCDKSRFGEEVTEKLEVIPQQLKVIRYIRPKYSCRKCEGSVSIAPIPDFLLAKSIATPSLLSSILINKYNDHLPLYRQSSIWARAGVDIPRNTMSNWLLAAAELCEPLWDQLKNHIIKHDYCQADETPVQVMKEPTQNNTKKSYMWVYRGGAKNKVVVFDYQETRSGMSAKSFLHEFKGYLQTDGYKGYDWVNDIGGIIHLGCMTHARRPFAELVKMLKKTGKAHQALSYIQSLYAIEKHCRENEVTFDERKAIRLNKSKPILDKFKCWLDKTIKGSPPQGKLGKGIKYILDRWGELTNFLKDGRLEIDNNGVENCIRPFAIGRKNWFFMGSPRGARAGVIFYSLIMTCKENDLEPYAYFNYMLQHLKKCKTDSDYSALLPFNISPENLQR